MKKEKQTQSHKGRGLLHIIFGRTMIMLVALAIQMVLLIIMLCGLLKNVPLLFGGTVVFTAVMLIYVLNTQANPSIKLSWCIVIAIAPLFGAVVYLYTHLDLGQRVERRLMQRTLVQSAAHRKPTGVDKAALPDPALRNLASYLHRQSAGDLYTNTAVRYFPLGEAMFEQMQVQLEQAEHFIFLEYFSIAPSYMWDTILEILIRKAAQGVQVRVLYDGGCAVADLPHDYPRQLQALGIQCKVFSPFRPFVSTHYNNRDHRKIMVIDGQVAFTGGINLLDRYINRKRVFGHWKDTAVMLQGDAVREFSLMFLQMWNYNEQKPVYAPYLPDPEPVSAPGYVIPYCDSPMDRERVGEAVYLDMLNRAQRYAYIMTPYLILDNELLSALCFAAKRGVDVRLILPHIPDKKYAFALARSHYRALAEAGVNIYEYSPGFVHAKTVLCDDREAVVGTINLDYRSLYLHFECAAYMYGVPALQDIFQDFQQTLEKCQHITLEQVRKTPLHRRLVGAALKLVAPLL